MVLSNLTPAVHEITFTKHQSNIKRASVEQQEPHNYISQKAQNSQDCEAIFSKQMNQII